MGDPERVNVLVVERDEDFGHWVTELFAAQGFSAAVIADAGQAADTVKRRRIPLVLVDLDAPAPGGLALVSELRGLDADLCILVASAAPEVASAVAAMKAGAFDYLRKPFGADDLRRVLAEAKQEFGLRVDLDAELNAVLGGRLRELRTERGLTLKQLAGRTGLSVSLISQIELAKSSASLSTLYKLATALGVKMTYFFESL